MTDLFAPLIWTKDPAMLFVFGLWMVAAVVLMVVLEFWEYRKRKGGVALLNLLISAAIWCIFEGLSVLSDSLFYKRMWMNLAFVGICAILPYAYLLGRMFPLSHKPMPRWLKILLGFFPLVTLILIFTNPLHGWMWSSIELSSTNILIYTSGWWNRIWLAYAYFLLFATLFYFIRALIVRKGLYRKQALYMMLAMLPPWIANIINMLEINTGAFNNYDPTPLAFGATAILLAINHRHFNFVKFAPVMHDWILENMQQGLMVVDQNFLVKDMNRVFCALLNQTRDDVLDRPLYELLPQYKEQFDVIMQAAGVRHHEIYFEDIGWVDVIISPLRKRGLLPPGWIVLTDDISVRKQAEIALNETHSAMQAKVEALQQAQHAIHILGDLVPLCQQCGRKIQQEDGTWIEVDKFIENHSESEMTHGICPECHEKHFH